VTHCLAIDHSSEKKRGKREKRKEGKEKRGKREFASVAFASVAFIDLDEDLEGDGAIDWVASVDWEEVAAKLSWS
jgi:hypothetical protein